MTDYKPEPRLIGEPPTDVPHPQNDYCWACFRQPGGCECSPGFITATKIDAPPQHLTVDVKQAGVPALVFWAYTADFGWVNIAVAMYTSACYDARAERRHSALLDECIEQTRMLRRIADRLDDRAD